MPPIQRLPRRRASSAASRSSARASARRSAISSSEILRPAVRSANRPRIRSAACRRRSTSERACLVAWAMLPSWYPQPQKPLHSANWPSHPHRHPHDAQKLPICRAVTSSLPRDDDRGRQVRARLLGRVCGVIGGQWGSRRSSKLKRVGSRTAADCPPGVSTSRRNSAMNWLNSFSGGQSELVLVTGAGGRELAIIAARIPPPAYVKSELGRGRATRRSARHGIAASHRSSATAKSTASRTRAKPWSQGETRSRARPPGDRVAAATGGSASPRPWATRGESAPALQRVEHQAMRKDTPTHRH